MPLTNQYTSRHTGKQVVYGLRTDLYSLGCEFQSVLGCLDAPSFMPAGSIFGVGGTTDYPDSHARRVIGLVFFRRGL